VRRIACFIAAAGVLALAGCNDSKTAAMPPPHELTQAAIGHYCGMNLMEHAGPKAQIILASRREPVWFSSARDAFSFTLLPEEAKDVSAIYVSDMGKAASWEAPGTTNWLDAKRALFVIGSRKKGGMGADETVPFSDRGAAETFAAENGGRVVTFADVPPDYVLGSGAAPTDALETAAPQTGGHTPAAGKHHHGQ
jgi:copper chaperone NosL